MLFHLSHERTKNNYKYKRSSCLNFQKLMAWPWQIQLEMCTCMFVQVHVVAYFQYNLYNVFYSPNSVYVSTINSSKLLQYFFDIKICKTTNSAENNVIIVI